MITCITFIVSRRIDLYCICCHSLFRLRQKHTFAAFVDDIRPSQAEDVVKRQKLWREYSREQRKGFFRQASTLGRKLTQKL